MTQLTASEVRTHLREVLERVQRGEDIEITQNGKVVAALLHPSKLRPRVRTPNTVAAETLLSQLRADREQGTMSTALSASYAEELITDIRRQRDGEHE